MIAAVAILWLTVSYSSILIPSLIDISFITSTADIKLYFHLSLRLNNDKSDSYHNQWPAEDKSPK